MSAHSTFSHEVWKVVSIDANYEVSNFGSIRRRTGGQGARVGRLVKSRKMKNGYYVVTLSCKRVRQHVTIHKLVAMAFVGKRPKGYEVNHKDGNKNNNSATNLEYVTKKRNAQHAVEIGLVKGKRGSEAPNVKLDESTVLEIVALRGKATRNEIAERFDVAPCTISSIHHGYTWSWLTGLRPKLHNWRQSMKLCFTLVDL